MRERLAIALLVLSGVATALGLLMEVGLGWAIFGLGPIFLISAYLLGSVD